MSKQSLITGPAQQMLTGEILRNVPVLADKLAQGVVGAKDAVANAASAAKEAVLDSVMPDVALP